MNPEIYQSIQTLATPEVWEEANALFSTGAVLDARYKSRVIEARVANDHGTFERVLLTCNRGDFKARCTCNAPFCPHIIATLLFVATDAPEKLTFLPMGNPAEEARPQAAHSYPNALLQPSTSAVDIAAFLEPREETPPRLCLTCDTPQPRLLLEKQTIFIQAKLIAKDGTEYSALNLKKLTEDENAGGGMRFLDFAPQSQQVIHFLVRHAQYTEGHFVLNSWLCADLFHCLRGSSIFHLAGNPAIFHFNLLEIQFRARPAGIDGFSVTPRLLMPGRGPLPADGLAFVAGRGGYWIGHDGEFWWFPAIIPGNWLRLFLQGESITLTRQQLDRLSALCDGKTFPGKVHLDAQAAHTAIATGTPKPVLTLDWDKDGLIADLQFDYAGRRVEVNGESYLWNGESFIRRNLGEEEATMNLLSNAGFIRQNGDSWHAMRLHAKEGITQFMQTTLPAHMEEWIVFQTPRVRINSLASSEATLTIRTGNDTEEWLNAHCILKTADNTSIPFSLAMDAILNNEELVRLPSGAIATLPPHVFNILNTLAQNASVRGDSQFRFKRYHALSLGEELAPFWEGERPDWLSLRKRFLSPRKEKLPKIPAKLKDTLRDYQREGLKWLTMLEQNGFNGILADEMGLGKTLQALSVLASRHIAGAGVSMIVCPTSLLENWRTEANRFTPELKVCVINGLNRTKAIQEIQAYDLAITSYANLRRDIREYASIQFDYVILDEAQHIKNPKTANAVACKALNSAHRLILTGTPMENSPLEIWSLFDFLQRGYLGTQRDFKGKFLDKANGARQSEKITHLSRLIRPFILRRTKNDVNAELPPKLEQDIYCEMEAEQQNLYNSMLLATRSFIERLGDNDTLWQENRMEMLAMILRLRQVCCHPGLLPPDLLKHYPKEMPSVKLALAKEVILEAIDSGHRILFFSQFTKALNLFPEWLRSLGIPFEYMDGTTKKRQECVDRFNSTPSIPIFLLSLKAGGLGLNLPTADTVIHFDQWWNPMVEDQATDRSHRIGQTRQVTSIRLITRNTIEERMIRLQNTKRGLFNTLLSNAPTAIGDVTREDIEFLLRP